MTPSTEMPIKELDALYNNMRQALGLEPAGKAKDKAAALARIEKIKPQYDAFVAEKLPKTKKKSGGHVGRFRFNYPVQSKVKPPSRNGTKLSKIVDMLESEGGATFDEIIAKTMEFTGEKFITTKEMATANREKKKAGEAYEGFCTDTPYRAWKELNNLVKKHGYGMRCLGEGERIYIFTSQRDIEAWDRENRKS